MKRKLLLGVILFALSFVGLQASSAKSETTYQPTRHLWVNCAPATEDGLRGLLETANAAAVSIGRNAYAISSHIYFQGNTKTIYEENGLFYNVQEFCAWFWWYE